MKNRVWVALVLVGATAHAKPAEFISRVPYQPLVAKLKESGGSPDRILHVQRASDLDALHSGRRYKFIVDARGRLAIAPLPADAPSNEYVHPILAAGAPVLTAGGLRVERSDGKVARVVVDQDSKAYCPTSESLAEAVKALINVGVPSGAVQRESRPPNCAQ
jgi:hypothetical protein